MMMPVSQINSGKIVDPKECPQEFIITNHARLYNARIHLPRNHDAFYCFKLFTPWQAEIFSYTLSSIALNLLRDRSRLNYDISNSIDSGAVFD